VIYIDALIWNSGNIPITEMDSKYLHADTVSQSLVQLSTLQYIVIIKSVKSWLLKLLLIADSQYPIADMTISATLVKNDFLPELIITGSGQI